MARTAKGDPLATYNAKRDFSRTREPKGERKQGEGNLFIVQKHDATRLHWDFRLELDGVLKSWAVTKGPSLDPADKRLAVRTEDHPMSYATFEGIIPKGEYGGGTVMLWDQGTWTPVPGKDPRRTLEEGHLHFTLDGERMKGEWLLVRLKPRPGEKRENWLLRKVADAEAGASGGLVDTALTSVKTGRSMIQIAEGKEVWHSNRAEASADPQAEFAKPAKKAAAARPRRSAAGKRHPLPAFQPPQLATLVDHVPSGSAWLHEVKYDGYRCLVAASGGEARAYTRTGLDWSDKFARVVKAVAGLGLDGALIDGEVVALDAKGRPSFQALKDALSAGGELHYFAFDLLRDGGEDLTGLSNLERKARLAALLEGAAPPIHYAEHITGGGEEMLQTLCREGYEGVVSKLADAPYRGRRTQGWVKTKCLHRQEFVIVGWTASDKARRGFRALLLGLNGPDGLRYAGKVGTGFDQAMMTELMERMRPLARKTATVEAPRAATRGAQWIAPKLVAEIAFTEFTDDGVLRHPSFIGLREDKAAETVVAETPVPAPDVPARDSFAGVKISNPDRVLFPEGKLTKADLAAYYGTMAEAMLDWMGDRPISLVRCPQGRAKQCFFQKHDAGSFGDAVHHVPIREKDGHEEPYLYVDDARGLMTCVQMGTIEFHGWGARREDVEKPDRMVFDLDPDVGLGFDVVKRAAFQLRDILGEMGLVSYPMLTGGKGVHLVLPLEPSREWPEVKDFAERFARAAAAAHPDRFTANMKKATRTDRIFLDWLRNQRGATAVMPYSARARAGAPVAAPVTWAELEEIETPALYHIGDAATLLARRASPALKDWGTHRQRLPDL
ncbi:DNA ligase D [Sphingomonas quercus]|uniref:DNA ligase (ATP) n=1 Tax=Sphingomonas quercus TaxID=2842451 RepID=A0ABS6BE75_9SPHN|nr:DNA ligase D [Sphingomonas quercus]MBU3076622.1 DNA ligase D [Sphingomonas quercus]